MLPPLIHLACQVLDVGSVQGIADVPIDRCQLTCGDVGVERAD